MDVEARKAAQNVRLILTEANACRGGEFFSGFVGGFVAWMVTTTVGEPLQRFLQLRREAAGVLVCFEDRPWIGNPEAKPPEKEWLDRRRDAYDKAGTALIAFADSNLLVTRLLRRRFLHGYRCNIRSAGENLRTLAEAYPGTQASAQLQGTVLRGLAMKAWPQNI